MQDICGASMLQVISLLLQLGVFPLAYKIYQNALAKSKARDNGTRAMLRVEITRICIKAQNRKGLFVYELESLTDMFAAYKALGGNGAIKEMTEHTLLLPIVPQGGIQK